MIAIGTVWTTLSCSSRNTSKHWQKLVVLGFDGMDPDLVQRWMQEGKLPNIRRIVEQGGLYPLTTTHSAESPTAWASFATGVNPGKHNIYDFLVRDTSTYLPDLGMVRREPAKFLFNYIPVAKPRLESIRGGTSFWVTAGRAGVRSSVLTVPVTFPPEEVPNGELLAGLPLPDIRGTMGTFYYFATDLSRYEEGNTEFGGILKRLIMEGDVAPDRVDRATEPHRQAANPGDPQEVDDAERRRPGGHRGARAERRRAAPAHRALEPRSEDRHRRTRWPLTPARTGPVEPMG